MLVRVIAAAVNPVDTYVRQGMRSKSAPENPPMIIGYDIAGVVEKTGAKIKKYKIGDSVYAYLSVPRGGGYAEYAIAKEDEMSLKPKSIGFEKAAAVPLAATTASRRRERSCRASCRRRRDAGTTKNENRSRDKGSAGEVARIAAHRD